MNSSRPDFNVSLSTAWATHHGQQSLPFVVAVQSSPEVVLGMLSRGWLVDFNEVDPQGISLAGRLYARTIPPPDGFSIHTLPEWSDDRGAGYAPRAPDDFGPIVAALVRCGANPWLRWEGSPEGVHLTREEINAQSGQSSLLHYAIAKSDAAMVNWLLDHPDCPSIQELSGWVVEKSMSHFYTLSSRPYLGPGIPRPCASLLHLAVNSNKESAVSIVDRLLSAGFDPNVEDDHGRTPLFYVRRRDILDLLLSRGASPAPGNASLFNFWRGHLETSQTLSDFQGPVLAKLALSQDPKALRDQQSPAFLTALMTGNKTMVMSLFRKVGFGYDYRFSVSQGSWNLVTPLLLRTDQDKVAPLMNWASPRVSWNEPLSESGATNLGIALLRQETWPWAVSHLSDSKLSVDQQVELLDGALAMVGEWAPLKTLYGILETSLKMGLWLPYEKAFPGGSSGIGFSSNTTLHYTMSAETWAKSVANITTSPRQYALAHGEASRLDCLTGAIVQAQVKEWRNQEKSGKTKEKISGSWGGILVSRSCLLLDDNDPAAGRALLWSTLLAASLRDDYNLTWAPHVTTSDPSPRMMKINEIVSSLRSHASSSSPQAFSDTELALVENFCSLSPVDLSDLAAWARAGRLSLVACEAKQEGRSRAPRM